MRQDLEQRTQELAVYMIENRSTIRDAAKHFGLSKSTVHKDLTCRLKKQNRILYDDVQQVLQINKQERHLRGGAATKKKYHPDTE